MATVQLWCNKHLRQSFEVIKHIVPILMHHKQSRNTLNLFANDRCLYEGPCSLAVAMASKLEECKSGLLLHCWSLFPFESKMATVRSITSWRPYSLYSITQKEVLLWPQPMMSTAKTAKPGNNVALKCGLPPAIVPRSLHVTLETAHKWLGRETETNMPSLATRGKNSPPQFLWCNKICALKEASRKQRKQRTCEDRSRANSS